MKFNPKARLDQRRMRDVQGARATGGGRSSGGGSGLQIPTGMGGKGVGGMIIALVVIGVSLWLSGGLGGLTGGGTSYDTSRMSDTDRYASCKTGEDANKSADCARVAVENSLYDYWSDALPTQTGTKFRAEKAVETFTGAVDTGCGQASADVGPFYCPTDETIYLDTTFFKDVLEKQLNGPSGDFVEPYVLAHEYGHHIQNLLGTMGRVKTQQGPKSDSVRLELQADCYAGLWARAATTTEDEDGNVLISELTKQDVQEAIDAATAVGDDRIQRQSGGSVDSDSWTHGSAAQRVQWFETGYNTGQIASCDTFAANAL